MNELIENALIQKSNELIYSDYPDTSTSLDILILSTNEHFRSLSLQKLYSNSNIYTQNIEDFTKELILKYDFKSFDYIILENILQKFIDPHAQLKYIKNFLKEDGYIIADVPNIMHYSSLANILCGHFAYSSEGILDKENLKFYTQSDLIRIFNICGMNVSSTINITTNNNPDFDKLIDNLSSISQDNLKLQANIYQFLVKSKNNPVKTLFDYI